MVQFLIRQANQEDVPFLWEMLFYAARMTEDGAIATDAAKEHPFLAKYVEGWGKEGDLGFVAIDSATYEKIGAAWLRLLLDDKTSPAYYDDQTPELAIAIHPNWVGKGIGSALLTRLIEAAKLHYPAIVLNVRADNPAQRLYKRLGFVTIAEIENRVKTKSLKMLLKLNRERA